MLSLSWTLSESMCLIICNKLGSPACHQWVLSEQVHGFSVLGHLIMIKYCVFKHIRFTLKLEKKSGPTGTTAGNFIRRNMAKKSLFWMKTQVSGGGKNLTVRCKFLDTYPVFSDSALLCTKNCFRKWAGMSDASSVLTPTTSTSCIC